MLTFQITNFSNTTHPEVTLELVESFLANLANYQASDMGDTWYGNESFDLNVFSKAVCSSEDAKPTEFAGAVYPVVNGSTDVSVDSYACMDLTIFDDGKQVSIS